MNHIPKWILIVSYLISFIGFFIGLSLYVAPSTFLKLINSSPDGALLIVHFWAARQITIATIILASAWSRYLPALKIALIGYAFINLQDIGIGIFHRDVLLTFGATLFTILPGIMVFKLRN